MFVQLRTILFCLILLGVCSAQGQRRRKGGDYVSTSRPTYELSVEDVPEIKSDSLDSLTFLNQINDSLSYFTDSMKVVYGKGVGKAAHSVLAYNGPNRDKALKIRRQILGMFPEARVNNEYVAPTWKVKVGPFIDKLMAVKIKEKLREKGHPNVLIIPDPILYRNGKEVKN